MSCVVGATTPICIHICIFKEGTLGFVSEKGGESGGRAEIQERSMLGEIPSSLAILLRTTYICRKGYKEMVPKSARWSAEETREK